MLPGWNLNRNWASKVLLLFLLGLLALGCVPAPAPDLGIDLSKSGAEICTTIAALEAEKALAFAAGQLAGCKADVVLSYPTYSQLQQFLLSNQALRMCEGNCIDHVQDLAEAANRAGWEMDIVLLNFKEGPTGHVLGAFQTDKGIIFIESQTLWEVKVEIGYDYALNFTSRNWSFPQSTIKQIGILR
jgi:hypothetical protein